MKRNFYFVVLACAIGDSGAFDEPPQAAALIKRFDREKSPMWADGDTATFFFRGEAQSVELIAGGDFKALERIPLSDVWSVTFTLPELERAVVSYVLTARKKGAPANQASRQSGVWRGPKAPPQAARPDELRGAVKTIEIASRSLDSSRRLTVYFPPGFEPGQARRVVYAADGDGIDRYARVLEPLITAGTIPPVVLVGVHNGGYIGGAPDPKNYDTKKDLRAQEYFPGINPDRFSKHEAFFCSEVAAWAEREWKVSDHPDDRAIFGCSNGGRFVFEMALRHPDRFGYVLAFSVPGGGDVTLPREFKTKTRFYLEAGTWERVFHAYTARLAEALTRAGVHVEYQSRVGGHDEAIWRDEFATAMLRAFRSR